MPVNCLGYRKPTKPLVRSISTVTTQSSEEQIPTSYSPACVLEDNNTRLQIGQRSAFTELIKILTNTSTKTREWKKKWHQFYENNQENVTTCETIWDLFDAAILSVDDFIAKTDESIEALTDARSSMPKPDKDQSLHCKIDKARSDVIKLTKELDELEEEIPKVKRKLHRLESNSPSNLSKEIDWETRQEDLNQRYSRLEISIENKKKLLEKQKTLFAKKQTTLFKHSQSVELERWYLLKETLQVLVNSLDINSDEFVEKSKNYDPAEDLKQWKRNVFHQKNKQTDISQITEDEPSGPKIRSNRNTDE